MRAAGRQELIERTCADRDREEEEEERPAEFAARERIYKVGDDEQCRSENAGGAAGDSGSEVVGETESEEPERREDQGEGSEGAREVTDTGAQREMFCDEPEGEEGEGVECRCGDETHAFGTRGHGDIVAGERVASIRVACFPIAEDSGGDRIIG